jgi:hypothetical protein
MVFHNKELNRLSNFKGNLKKFTLNELKRIDIGSFFLENLKMNKYLH